MKQSAPNNGAFGIAGQVAVMTGGEPADIGRAVLWPAPDLSDYMNGTTMFANSAMPAYPRARGAG